MNYSAIHYAIKTGIKDAGFRYWYNTDWFDMAVGKLPEAAMQDGFAIRFISQEPSATNSDIMVRMGVEIEFALEARKDRYLTRMNDAQTAVAGLRDALANEGLSSIDGEIWPSFTMQYLAGEIVAMTFTIYFDM